MSQNKGRVTIPTNLDEIQQMYIMSFFHTAISEKLEIHLMDHLYPDMRTMQL